MAKNKEVKRGVVIYLDGKLVKNNAVAIQAEIKKIKKELDKCTIGTEEYIQKSRKLKQLNTIYAQHRQAIKQVEVQQESMLSKGIGLWSKYFSAVITAITGITGAIMAFNKYRKLINETEESQASLKALTGLDDSSIEWLTQQASQLATKMEANGLRVRKGVSEILEAYKLVGSNRPDLLTVKEDLNAVTIEAMRLSEAGGIDLETAVNALTTALNQFNAPASEAAKYVNVIAAGSKYGAANIQEQADAILRSGTAAHMAGLEFESLDAAIEVLGYTGQKGEKAGTYLQSMLLKLATGERAAQLKTEGLLAVISQLKREYDAMEKQKVGSGMAALTKEFSECGIRAVTALINNIDLYASLENKVTGTNIAIEQAAINSDTMNAKLDQYKNRINKIGKEIVQKMMPIVAQFMGLSMKMANGINGTVGVLSQYGKYILEIGAAILIYNTRLKLMMAVQAAWSAYIKISTSAVALYKLAMTELWNATNAYAVNWRKLMVEMKASNIIMQGVTASIALMKAAWNLLTLNINGARKAWQVFVIAIKSNPFGFALAAITAVVIAVTKYNDKMKEARDERMKNITSISAEEKQYFEESAKIDILTRGIKNNKIAIEERRKMLERLKEIIPGYKADLTDEGKLINNNTTAIDNYLSALKKKIAMQAAEEKLTELLKEQMTLQAQRKKLYDELAKMDQGTISEDKWTNHLSGGAVKNSVIGRGLMNLPVVGGLFEAIMGGRNESDDVNDELNKINNSLAYVDEQIKQIQTDRDELVKTFGDSNEPVSEDPIIDPDPKDDNKTVDIKKDLRDKLSKVDAEYDAKVAAAKKRYIDGEIKSEAELNQTIQQLEIERIEAKLKVAGIEEGQQQELINKILDIRVKLVEELKNINSLEVENEKNALRRSLDENKKSYEARLSALKLSLQQGLITEETYNRLSAKAKKVYDAENRTAYEKDAKERADRAKEINEAELRALEAKHYTERTSEESYQRAYREMKKQFLELLLQDQKLSLEDRNKIQRELEDINIDEMADNYDRIREKNEELFNSFKEIGQGIGEEIGKLLDGTTDDFGEFAKNVLKIVLDTIEKMMTAYIAQATMRNIASMGWLGLAKAAGEIALITAAFESAKAAIGNFYVGGYTGAGEWNQPAGFVHKGEFVASKQAVGNQNIKNVLDLINSAQKTGQVANLTSDDIARVNVGTSSHTKKDTEMKDLMKAMIITLRSVKDRFDSPIVANTYATGKNGTIEAEKLVDKMHRNVRRN